MPDDLKIIKQLEKQTRRELWKRPLDEIMECAKIGFSIKKRGQVNGLNLETKILTSTALTTLSLLHHLEKLCLSYTGITDISSLQGLRNLTHLDLGNNQITDVSSLDWQAQL